jgi:serine/threonine protein kinase
MVAPGTERYEIQHPIGAGVHAEVLLGAVRGADGFCRPVAVKRVRSDLANHERFVAMLVEVAHLASQLSHPNVVSILDLGRDTEQRPYLIMDHVDGVDLGKLIETGPLPHSVAIFIVRELLSGLGYIHESRGRGQGHVRGLVHRDVTPRNVLLSWEGEVKLADFGVAQLLEGAMTVGANACVGMPGYMSPEQGEPRGARWPVRSVRGRDRALGAPRAQAASRRAVGRRRSDDRLPGHPVPERLHLAKNSLHAEQQPARPHRRARTRETPRPRPARPGS